MGVAIGILSMVVGMLVRSFSMFVREGDADMHTQQRWARFARQVGDFPRDLL
jgi:hypothetical protein